MQTDFFKLLNTKPLQEIGLPEEEMRKLVISLMSFANLELRAKLTKVLGQETKETDIEGLEGAYHQKTGNYFMEELRQILNEYISLTAKMLVKVKDQAVTAASKDPQKVKALDEAVKNKDFDLAAKLTDELAKEVND
jgi:hypothetical protein